LPPHSRPAFSRKRADHVVKFIENLTLSTDSVASQAGAPFVLRPWQKAIVRELFGRVRTDDATRRSYRTAFIALPRKNGKSELCAALALYGLIGDGVKGGQVYSAAAERGQAELVFNAAMKMVENDPELSDRIKVLATNKRMVDKPTGSIYQALSAEAYSKHGFNASMVIYDELHAAPNRELWDVLRTSQGARREPLMVAITTAGFDKTSICWELWDYARKVRDGDVVDPAFFQVLYEAPEGSDWTDEAVWRAANPALGDFRDIEEMRAWALESAHKPEQQNSFRRLYLNQWTEQETRWLDMHRWTQCRTVSPDLVSEWSTLPAYGGLDLGLKSDLSAFVAVTPLPEGTWLVRAHFWMPRGAMDVYRQRPYETWKRSGVLTITDGDVTDFDRIEMDIARLWKEWNVVECFYDQAFAEALRQRLVKRLWPYRKDDDTPIRQQSQGYALNIGLRAIEEAVVAGSLAHHDNPVLTWMAGNAVVETGKKGDIQLRKMKARDKVDGIAALSMAMQLASIRQKPESHVYDRREVLVL
jgi:phage terminase large subunit-like protein